MRALLFRGGAPILIGVVHLEALPGAPGFGGDLEAVLGRAVEDAAALAGGGADAVIVENFGDAPFFATQVPPETVACMARAVEMVCGAVEVPVGVNVLRNDARSALGLCAASEASFLRVNVHTGAAVTDQGIIQGVAAQTLRVRAQLAPEAVLFADVHVKHASPMGDETIAEAAAETFGRGCADALVISGSATGLAAERGDLEAVKERVADAPLFVGSGLTEHGASAVAGLIDGAFVGTALKRDGDVTQPVEKGRVEALRAALDGSR